jgi:homoserine O-acetyltransferase
MQPSSAASISTECHAVTVPYYSQQNHGPFETFAPGDFDLESGDKLRGASLTYATFGTLAADRRNAILFPTWCSGTSKILELAYIAPGRALDPSKYFIILVNQIGNGLSSSPSNAPAPFNAARFPRITIGDDVRAQHRLISEKFGIEQLALVLGGSMGAQQTYEWAVRFPEAVARAAPIAGTARTTAHSHAIDTNLTELLASH